MSVAPTNHALCRSHKRRAKAEPRTCWFLERVASLLRLRWLQLLTLAGLLVAVGVIAFNLKFSVLDLDIWWHLKVGDWIVQHLAVPHNGIFSWTAADRPWWLTAGAMKCCCRAPTPGLASSALECTHCVDPRRRYSSSGCCASFRPILAGLHSGGHRLLGVSLQPDAAPSSSP